MPDPEPAANGNDIIIKGGSVEVHFDDTGYVEQQPGEPKDKKNDNKKMTQVVIFDDQASTEIFNSGPHQGGLKWTVKISTPNK